ncbi:MAG: YigZ family protein [Candidatus Cloacimonetes bacterium]|nr:YigZ family protein [Candidatus Cloacimonadota bacterium]
MFLIKTENSSILEEKKSKFISYLMFYKDFKETMLKLKLDHPKARHFVFAFRYLNEEDQVVEGFSDDGEPKNTSGKPTLAVLQGHKLINVALITVRYFGGVKLGTGGLVRAYSDACNLAIEENNLQKYIKLEIYKFSVLYSHLSSVEHKMKSVELNVIDKEFGATNCEISIRCSKDNWLNLQQECNRMIEVFY